MAQVCGMGNMIKTLPLVLFVGCASEDDASSKPGAKPVYDAGYSGKCSSASGAYLLRKTKISGNCEFKSSEEVIVLGGPSSGSQGCTRSNGSDSTNNCESTIDQTCSGQTLRGVIRSSIDGTYLEGTITQSQDGCEVTAKWTLTKQ